MTNEIIKKTETLQRTNGWKIEDVKKSMKSQLERLQRDIQRNLNDLEKEDCIPLKINVETFNDTIQEFKNLLEERGKLYFLLKGLEQHKTEE